MVGDPPGLAQLLSIYDSQQLDVVGVQEVPVGQEHLYGIVGGDRIADAEGAYRLNELIEKPAPGTAPSRLAIIGRTSCPPRSFRFWSEPRPAAATRSSSPTASAPCARRRGRAASRSRAAASARVIAWAT